MGNKDIARELAIKNNLPICPGLNNEELKNDDLEKKCNEIGYPILNKGKCWWWWNWNANCKQL